MSSVILFSVISLSALGIILALVLYGAATKFYVYEDPRIDQVEEALPNTNCGACGFPGCRNFAEAIVSSDDISAFYCPVGGNDTMKDVAKILGKEAAEQDSKVAVLKCNGTHAHSPKTSAYDGPASCAIEHNLYGGETGCQYGCMSHGDCVDACDFDAIHINPETGLPEVVDENCTACGLCVTACPRNLIELRPRRKKERKIYIACMNQDPGATPKKSCSTACIGCALCEKACRFDAITMDNNLAYIHPDKCTLCRECVPVCPTNAILEIGFPPRKNKAKAKDKPKAKAGADKSTTTAASKTGTAAADKGTSAGKSPEGGTGSANTGAQSSTSSATAKGQEKQSNSGTSAGSGKNDQSGQSNSDKNQTKE